MKRSERYLRESLVFALQSALFASAAIAGAVWGINLVRAENAFGILLLAVAPLCVVFIVPSAIESLRLYQLSRDWERSENEKSIRPRI